MKRTGPPQDDPPGVPEISRDMMAKPNVKSLESRSPLLEDGTSSET